MATWTWNPSDKGADISLSGGDLIATNANNWDSVRALYSKNAGKWYWEVTVNDNSYIMTGVGTSAASLTSYVGSDDYGVGLNSGGGWYLQDTKTFTNQGRTAPAVSNDDEVCVALDLDNGKLWIGVNGVWPNSGDPAAGTNPCFTFSSGTTLFPMVSVQTSYCTAAFLTSSFSYSVPSGFSGIADIIDYTTETLTLTDSQKYLYPYSWARGLYGGSVAMPYSNNDLTTERTVAANTNYYLAKGLKAKTANKWYAEFTIDVQEGTGDEIGIGDCSGAPTYGYVNVDVIYTKISGYEYGWAWTASASPTWEQGDVVMLAVDIDTGKLWFGKNGTWNSSGNPSTGANPSYTGLEGRELSPLVAFYARSKITANFGASAFSYAAPTGFEPFGVEVLDTEETVTLTDSIYACYHVDGISDTVTLTDSPDYYHLVAYTEETATLTDVNVPHRTTYAQTTDTATITDANVAYHLVEPTSETATVTDEAYASSVIRKRVRFPNTQGKHIGLKFESATDDIFAVYYLRNKMFKTRELCSDQKHPNTQGDHIGLKLSNSGTDDFILMYVSQEHYMVNT